MCPPYAILRVILLAGCTIVALACESGGLHTNKMVAPAMVSKLYGSSKQVLTVNHDETSHIAWMGFIQGNDYEYFKVTKVQVGSTVIAEDGEDSFTASSATIHQDISVSPSSQTDNEFTNGSINVGGAGDLRLTFTYTPAVAIESDVPHTAYYIVYYDEAILRIKLEGYTQGIESEKCAQSPGSMDIVEFNAVDDKFNLYLCGSEVKNVGMNNATDHGSSTNLAEVPLDAGTIFTFYMPDDQTVCVLGSSSSVDTPTIPDFSLPIPDGLAPITSMEITLQEGTFAECTLDADGNVGCPAEIMLSTGGLVPMTGFSATNQTLTADDLTTADCDDFGEISGAGTFDPDSPGDITIIVTGEVLSGTNSDVYNITGALVVGELKLTPAQ